jgi:iron-sulfur cluster assembly accessory protein
MEEQMKLDITLSEEAVYRINKVISSQKDNKTYYLRLMIQNDDGRIAYGLALDVDKTSDDFMEVHQSGIRIVVDNISAYYMRGTEVHYGIQPNGTEGFVLSVPKAKSHGCGSCTGDAGCCT